MNINRVDIKQYWIIMALTVIGFFIGTLCIYPGTAGTLSAKKVFEWGTGEYLTVRIQDDYAYCAASGGSLDIVDISSPQEPVIKGRYRKLNFYVFRDIAVHGNFLYLTAGTRLEVIDVTNPSAPTLKGSCNTNGETGKIGLFGNYAYVEVFPSSMEVFDVSNPENPKSTAFLTINRSTMMDSEKYDKYLFLANMSGLSVFDISTPSSPVPVWTFNRSQTGFFQNIAITGHYWYVVDSLGKLYVYDIVTPSSPVLVKTIKLVDAMISQISVDENRLFVTAFTFQPGENGFFKLFDISDPLSPAPLGEYTIPVQDVNLLNFDISGNQMAVALGKSGLHILSVETPSSIAAVGSLEQSGRLYDIDVVGNSIVIIGTSLRIFDPRNSSSPQLIGYSEEVNGTHTVLFGSNAYHTPLTGNGIYVSDISSPNTPIYIGKELEADYAFPPNDMVISGRYAYILDNQGKVSIAEFTLNPIFPNMKFIKGDIAEGKNLAIKNQYLFISHDQNGIRVFNISNPNNPTAVDTYKDYKGTIYFDPLGRYLYTANQKHIDIIDTFDPLALKKVGIIDASGTVSDLAFSGKYAYIALGEKGFDVVDISDILSPLLVLSVPVDGKISSIATYINYVYGVDNFSGRFYTYMISETARPMVVLTSPNGGETFQVGRTYSTGWIHSSMPVDGTVTLSLYKGDKFHSKIVDKWPVYNGSFSWTIPDTVKPGNNYKIRISYDNMSDYSDSNFSITGRPALQLDHKKLYFRGVEGAVEKTTSDQTVRISNTGSGSLQWTVSTQYNDWIGLSPISGTGNGVLTVGVKTTGLAVGTYTAVIQVIDTAAANSPQEVSVTLKVSKTSSAPFGEISTPVNGSHRSGSVIFTGWALDDVEISSIKIYRRPAAGEGNKDIYIGDAVRVEGARPDVELAYPNYPMNYKAGWGYMLLSNILPNSGNGTYIFYIDLYDKEGNKTPLGEKTLICDNANAVKPFGALDTPSQGGTASGAQYINFGWALTPLPNTIPTDGSTIHVFVDGKAVGHPVYNQNRPDIAGFFPAYNNSSGAGGYFYLDTTFYVNGFHTIGWTVKDDAGNEEGIGSRFFSILNSSQNTQESESQNAGSLMGHALFTNPSDYNSIPLDYSSPVWVKKGFDDDIDASEFYPDETGVIRIQLAPLGRAAIRLFDAEALNPKPRNTKPGTLDSSSIIGYMNVGDQLRPLPIGSTLDLDEGIFYWQPGPGFVGEYCLIFIKQDFDGTPVKKQIVIKI